MMASFMLLSVQAAASGADLVHFSECALSGYAGVEFASFEGFDW